MQMFDALLHQEILLTVLDLGGVMECLAHVAEFVQRTNSITVGVWDALDGFGGRLAKRNGGVHALDERDV